MIKIRIKYVTNRMNITYRQQINSNNNNNNLQQQQSHQSTSQAISQATITITLPTPNPKHITLHTLPQMPAVSSSNISVPTPALQTQLLNKVNILLDKPISPLSTKQLIQLIKHESSPKEKIFQKLFGKYRGDLMLVMLQLYPYLLYTNKKMSLQKILQMIRADIMHYDIRIVEQLWAVVMEIILRNQDVTVEESQGQVYMLGYEQLLKDGLKVTNLDKKDRLFQVIEDNVGYMWHKGLKQAMRKVVVTYVEVFVKYPMAVSSYVKTMRRILQIIEQANSADKQKRSDKQIEDQREQQQTNEHNKREQQQANDHNDDTNTNQQQHTDSLQQIPSRNPTQQQQQQQQHQPPHPPPLPINTLPPIPTNSLTLILSQCLTLLNTTSSKPLHMLHSQCMLLVQQILKTAGRQILGMESVMKYELQKVLEVYLFRKGVRDAARRVVVGVRVIEKKVAEENRLKMVKGYGEQLSQQLQGERPLGEVIAKTNNYLLKYQLDSMDNQGNNNLSQLDNVLLQKSSIRFLKRGQGQGGGKTYLQLQDIQRGKSNYKTKDKYVSQYSVSQINKSNVKVRREGYGESVSKRKVDRIEVMLESCLRKGWGRGDDEKKGEQKRQSRKEERRESQNRGSGNNKSDSRDKNKYYLKGNNKQLPEKKPLNNPNTNPTNKNPNPKPTHTPSPLQLQQSLHSQFYYQQQQQYQPHPYSQTNASTISQQQVDEINQLIDLAYSYKFSI